MVLVRNYQRPGQDMCCAVVLFADSAGMLGTRTQRRLGHGAMEAEAVLFAHNATVLNRRPGLPVERRVHGRTEHSR